jgi:anhydro-N-acetylmuramic acid kinase
MSELYVGVMSGTSLDGVDVVVVELDEAIFNVRAMHTTAYPDELGAALQELVLTAEISLLELGRLDVAVGEFVASVVLDLLADSNHGSRDIRAIGFSGHTVFHQPEPPRAFSLQLGNPNTIAALTRITTVADLRGMDIALGGQGAPLVPAFHAWRFASASEARIAVNIGGIANLTCLDPQRPLRGFDSGPGNTLMDAWCRRAGRGPFDKDGVWAASGTVDAPLLRALKADAYFAKQPPKSTGLEYFNLAWLDAALEQHAGAIAPVDVQATLLELTATTIAAAIESSATAPDRLILCGGGAYNKALIQRLERLVAPTPVESSTVHGIAPEWVEAAAFAWLARARLQHSYGNSPSVTGAREPAVLGGVYSANK